MAMVSSKVTSFDRSEAVTYPFVLGPNRESLTGYAPSDRKCIELLNVLSTPDIGAGQALENRCLVVNDPGAVT